MRFFVPGLSWLQSLRGYQAVQRNIEDDTDEESGKQGTSRCVDCARKLPSARRSRLERLFWPVKNGWAVTGILAILLSLVLLFQDTQLQAKCFKETSSYSPLLNEVPNTLEEFRFNGSIRWPSPYRGPPSPSIDQAWERVSMFRPLNIHLTESEYRKIGRSPKTAATNPVKFGGGYFLQPEFSHQLHCVNLLRKVSHFKFDYYKDRDSDFQDKDETFMVHIDHCVEMLRQFVMCHADLGLVTAHWIEQRARPWPDFNTKHTCRNFDDIWQWTVDHQMPEGTPMIPMKPEGARALASPP